MKLPSETQAYFITDGGLETDLIFNKGIHLPYFAAFTALEKEEGLQLLSSYYQEYFNIAETYNVSFIIDTPTWRASKDWAALLGRDETQVASINKACVKFIRNLQASNRSVESILNGVIGPRGDGYVADKEMSIEDAASYHHSQLESFKLEDVDMVSAITMCTDNEAIGITLSAKKLGLPIAVSFTVETDGNLPSGQSLKSAIENTDKLTSAYPIYYMINCAHPSHFFDNLSKSDPDILQRIRGVRANASCKSHEELDDSDELDRGMPKELANEMYQLKQYLPNLNVIGGCCGTDAEHIDLMLRQYINN